MSNSWTLSWALQPHLMKGRRVILVTVDDQDTIGLASYAPPAVAGMSPTRLAPGVFGYKTGATLSVWPPERSVGSLAVSDKDFHVVLDPHVMPTSAAPETAAIHYKATRSSVRHETMVFASVTLGNVAISAKMNMTDVVASESFCTMPYACGRAAGNLLLSSAARWIARAVPDTILLCDALGRSVTVEDVMPVLEMTAMGGKKFRLNLQAQNEIRFTQVNG